MGCKGQWQGRRGAARAVGQGRAAGTFQRLAAARAPLSWAPGPCRGTAAGPRAPPTAHPAPQGVRPPDRRVSLAAAPRCCDPAPSPFSTHTTYQVEVALQLGILHVGGVAPCRGMGPLGERSACRAAAGPLRGPSPGPRGAPKANAGPQAQGTAPWGSCLLSSSFGSMPWDSLPVQATQQGHRRRVVRLEVAH